MIYLYLGSFLLYALVLYVVYKPLPKCTCHNVSVVPVQGWSGKYDCAITGLGVRI